MSVSSLIEGATSIWGKSEIFLTCLYLVKFDGDSILYFVRLNELSLFFT